MIAPSLLQCSFGAKPGCECRADPIHSGNDSESDTRSDQAVFDDGCAEVVRQELVEFCKHDGQCRLVSEASLK